MFESKELAIRPLTRNDLPLLHNWLLRPHVRAWWSSTEAPPCLEEVLREYDPQALAEQSVTPYVALLAGTPIGYAQSYSTVGCGGGWWDHVNDPGILGIDQFIADADCQGQGLGTQFVRSLVELLFKNPAVTAIQCDPAPDNLRAVRCYEKVGFLREAEIMTPDGPAIYMKLTRAAFFQSI